MEENKVTPNVVVEAPEGVTVEVIYGELDQSEKELVVEEAPVEAPVEEEPAPEAPVEETPAEEAPAEEAPAEEPAPEEEPKEAKPVESEPERIYASDEEVKARIEELEANKEQLVKEGEELDAKIDELYVSKRAELYAELRESIQSAVAIAETNNSLDSDFREAIVDFNRSYGEVDYLLAYLKSKKEAR